MSVKFSNFSHPFRLTSDFVIFQFVRLTLINTYASPLTDYKFTFINFVQMCLYVLSYRLLYQAN